MDPFFSRPVPNCEPPEDAKFVDLRDCEQFTPLERQANAEELLKRRQGEPEWFRERWGGSTSSRQNKALGYFCRTDEERLATIHAYRDEMWAEWEGEFYEKPLRFESEREREVAEERMAHGSKHEDDGMASLLLARPSLRLRECVLQRVPGEEESIFRGSQDGAGVDARGRRVSVEIKCPYGNRDPRCYTGVKDYYVAQMQLHMQVERSTMCYFVCWTPRETRVWMVMRSDEFWTRLADYHYELLAGTDRGLCDEWVLSEARWLRSASTRLARASREIRGSPFPSAWAVRHE